jgi:hypothetical protein
MDPKTIQDIKRTIFHQIIVFDKRLYGRDLQYDDSVKSIAGRVNAVVDKLVSKGGDFDLWVFLTYRHGKKLSKKSFTKELKPKSLVNAMSEGFDVPEEASLIEIEIKPVLYRGYDRNVLPDSVYSSSFALGQSEGLTTAQLKRRHGLSPEGNLFSVEDLKTDGKILKFYKAKKLKNKDVISGPEM